MSDGRVIIEVELSDGQAVRGISDIDKRLNGLDPSARKADNSIKNMVTSLGLVKLASAGFDILNKSLDAAISRFDTMESFPKVMKALGFSTEESTESVNKLANGIDGLPTKLDDVVSTTKKMTSITGNLNKSTDATLALNNAMLASGASTSDASRGMDQYIQMLSTGKVDLQSWKTLQETMPIGLQKTAEAMGFVGETAQRDLYGALKEGDITFKEFQNQLIELGTGTGELAELARINSEGIATSFGNLRNATSKGLANLLKDFDNLSKEVTGKNIAQNLDGLKGIVNKSFSAMGKAIEMTTPVVILSAKAFGTVVEAAKFLSPVLIGVAAGYATLKVIQTINGFLKTNYALVTTAQAASNALTITLKAQAVATEAGTIATKAQTAAEMAKNGQLTIGTALVGVLTGGISLQTVATTLATAATTAFGTALKVMTGPVGWVVAGVSALVAGATALWKWFNKDTEATAKLKKEQSELNDATEKLNESSKQAGINRAEEITTIESQSVANKELVQSVNELAGIEKKSAGEKKLLKEQVEMLNKSYEGLNLQYNEETGNLSMTTEALNAKIEAQKEQETMIAGQEQLLEISKEQADVDAKIAEAAELRKQYNEQLDGSWKESKKAKEGLKELDETETALKETQTALGEEYDRVSQVVAESSEKAAAAVKESAAQQTITYESLSEAQRESIDSMRQNFQSLHESATSAFSKINTDSETNMWEMLENLNHNQEAVKQWGENQAALLEWAGKSGHESFIPFIESIGVDQAGVLAEMVKGLDASNVDHAAVLEQLAQTYDKGFGTAAKAGEDSMKHGLEGLPEEIRNMVITPTTSINQDVKLAFEGMGKNVGEGAKKGVEASSKGVEDATKNMAENADKAFTGHMQIKSPSRLFKSHGENIGAGLSLGVLSQVGTVSKAINVISTAMTAPFNNTNRDMYNVGSYAMQGLNLGLINGSFSVYNTAQNIANNVKRIIQDAMDINSPSRWMKNFIGRNMMVGWSDGLDQYSNLPINSIKKASEMVKLPVLKAESLIGNPFATNSSILNQTSNSTSNTNKTTVNNKGMFEGAVFNWHNKDDIRKTMQEIAWMTEVEGADMNA
ncbi:tape measure protein [Vagococcus fluvialis]|uniref:tape measure protein n=1 Tax=Vagococcus fluvialis TaxID=2738 RepID=UPI000B73925E|nr:tape measure protein [Vagococcus fluvialis]MBO0419108.1 tape measure protein [Vagococcus fluvialis]OTP29533.1 hypothetical protein A5798_002701 [Enterococcus sp. 6C8_DIV0013]